MIEEYPRSKTCAFTGHRNISESDIPAIAAKTEKAIVALSDLGVRRFIAGGAVGFDMLAAISVYNLRRSLPDGTRLTLALPCERHFAKWGINDAQMLAYLLERADEVVYVGREYTKETMKARNAYMVDRSAVLISYLLPEHERTGTAQTVRMAKAAGARIINIATGEDSMPGIIPDLVSINEMPGSNISFI